MSDIKQRKERFFVKETPRHAVKLLFNKIKGLFDTHFRLVYFGKQNMNIKCQIILDFTAVAQLPMAPALSTSPRYSPVSDSGDDNHILHEKAIKSSLRHSFSYKLLLFSLLALDLGIILAWGVFSQVFGGEIEFIASNGPVPHCKHPGGSL